MQRTIIWIASYPKSGNTWLRFMACNLVFGRQDSASALARLAPDVHELAGPFAIPTQTQLLKTHFPCSERLQPLMACTAGAIHVVRHPADVMVSNFHYARRRSGAGSQQQPGEFAAYVDRFIEHRGDPHWSTLGMGSWEQSVRSWRRPDLPFPVLQLRYEDMLAAPVEGARRLSGFLGIVASDERLRQAVADSSFERMREIEEADIRERREGIFYKPYLEQPIHAGLRFMRGGRSGESAEVLSAAQRQQFAQALGPAMREAGYEAGAASSSLS